MPALCATSDLATRKAPGSARLLRRNRSRETRLTDVNKLEEKAAERKQCLTMVFIGRVELASTVQSPILASLFARTT